MIIMSYNWRIVWQQWDWDVTMRLDSWNIGLHLVHTSILHVLCAQSKKKSSYGKKKLEHIEYWMSRRYAHMAWNVFLQKPLVHVLNFFNLQRTYKKKLALSYNKTWDHGRREVRSVSSSNTYEKQQLVLIKQIQIKINKGKFTLYLLTSSGWHRLPDSVLVITSSFQGRFEWFQSQKKVES